MDNDGDLDIIGSSYGQNLLTWWQNRGDLRFTRNDIADDLTNIDQARAVDLDLDGDMDILTAIYGADQIAWWENLLYDYEPDISVFPSPLEFGDVEFKRTSEAFISITNNGSTDITITDIYIEGEGFNAELPGRLKLETDEIRCIPISFYPQELGEHNGVLLIASNDPDEPLLEISMTGNAIWVSPIDLLQRLIQHVHALQDDGILNRGQANSLIVKLEGAIAKLERNQLVPACNKINAFTNHTEDFVEDEILSSEEGRFLIDEVEFVLFLLNEYGIDGGNQELVFSSDIPSDYQIENVYPNPFNSTTEITYGLPVESSFSLKLCDISGREVRRLFEGSKPAGFHTLILSASDLPSGLYLVELESTRRFVTRKVMLIR